MTTPAKLKLTIYQGVTFRKRQGGAQIYVQQVASAYNIVNTSASISGSASMSITQAI